jgi:hypothetical protein
MQRKAAGVQREVPTPDRAVGRGNKEVPHADRARSLASTSRQSALLRRYRKAADLDQMRSTALAGGDFPGSRRDPLDAPALLCMEGGVFPKPSDRARVEQRTWCSVGRSQGSFG